MIVVLILNLLSAFAQDAVTGPFAGITASSGCSAAFVRFRQSLDQDKALVLTNGHCTGRFIDPGQFRAGERAGRYFYLLNSRTGERIERIPAETLLYATMTGTDLALYELHFSFEELRERYGIAALVLSERPSRAGQAFKLVSGFLRFSRSCTLERIISRLQEGAWVWNSSLRYGPGCDSGHGSSGSPLIDTITGEVIGIHNTFAYEGTSCAFNTPCEIDSQGQTRSFIGQGYGQQTHLVYGCVNEHRRIDLSLPTCTLTGGAAQRN